MEGAAEHGEGDYWMVGGVGGCLWVWCIGRWQWLNWQLGRACVEKDNRLAITQGELDVWVVVVGMLEESDQGFLAMQPNAKKCHRSVACTGRVYCFQVRMPTYLLLGVPEIS